MDESNKITNLLKALCLARREFPEIPRTREGQIQNRKFKYADLADIHKAIGPVMAKHELVITHQSGDGTLKSYLFHAPTGEAINTSSKMPATDDLKTVGANFTYLRRYNIQNLLDIATEEDMDAVESKAKAAGASPAAPKPFDKGEPDEFGHFGGKPPQKEKSQPASGYGRKVTDPQLKRLFAISKNKGWTHEQCKLYIKAAWGLESSKDLNVDTYDLLIKVIESSPYVTAIKELKR